MGRVCTICSSPSRHEIEVALVNREGSYRDIARRFLVSKDAISRHVNDGHIAERLAKARDARESADADKLLGNLKGLHSRTVSLLNTAEAAGEIGTALRAVREVRGNLVLLAKLLGELDERPMVNVLVSPEWIETRTAIILALEPVPAAQ